LINIETGCLAAPSKPNNQHNFMETDLNMHLEEINIKITGGRYAN